MYAVILAGGGGTRLWPLSRPDRPKQFLPLLGDQSLIQQTVARLAPLITSADVFVVTERTHAALVRAQLGEVAPDHVLAEPVGRNTAAALALATLAFQRGDDDVLVALPADHRIGEEAAFRDALAAAGALASDGRIVVLGIEPRGAEARFGYIVRDEAAREVRGLPTYGVTRFVEKPDAARAGELLASGSAYWNAGIVVARRDTLERGLDRYASDIVDPIRRAVARGNSDLAGAYQNLRATSIDYALLEPAAADHKVSVVPADVHWSDLGSWSSLLDELVPASRSTTDGRTSGGRVLQAGESAPTSVDDLLVYRSDGELVLAQGDGATIDCTTPTALLSGARDRKREIEALLERVATMERMA